MNILYNLSKTLYSCFKTKTGVAKWLTFEPGDNGLIPVQSTCLCFWLHP